jgi:putative FmdB family regulatory protein
MPIYEYACEKCGHELERLQKISDEPLRDCPACEKPGLRKKVSAAGFRLKGGGWYETDFKAGQKRNLADSGDGTGGSQGDSAKTEKKAPADTSSAKTEKKPATAGTA